jgi:hypothetical protein
MKRVNTFEVVPQTENDKSAFDGSSMRPPLCGTN